MSTNWTIQNTSVVGETQWMNANYIDIPVANGATGETDFIEISGYTAGSISFTTDQPPSGWSGGSSLDVSIQGAIGGTFAVPDSVFFAQTLAIPASASGLTTFVVEWNVPLQFVKLYINNDGTGPRNITNIRLICESQGGGIGYTSSSGATIGPGGSTPQIQFNDGGVFGGAAGAEYDKTNTQILFTAGTNARPPVAFQGDPDTGMYSAGANIIGFATGGTAKVGILDADGGGFINGLNVGTPDHIAGIRRLSAVADNSWEDGHMGNSAQLVFTPTDFIAQSATRPTALDSSQPNPGARASRWYGTLNQAGVILAQKVIPKGFQIGEDQEITIFTPHGIIPNTTCYVSAQSVDIGNITLLDNLLSDTNFASNSATSLAGGATVVGDGKKIITIFWDAGMELTLANSPSGAIITMIRV